MTGDDSGSSEHCRFSTTSSHKRRVFRIVNISENIYHRTDVWDFSIQDTDMEFKYILMVVLVLSKEASCRFTLKWSNRTDADVVLIGDEEIHSAIARFQDQEDPWLYADKVPLSSRLFNRYRTYYASQVIPDEAEEKKYRCPPGQYINGFHATNPMSTYFDNHRIYKVVFTCFNRKTGETSQLDIYKEKYEVGRQSLTLNPDRKLDQNETCNHDYAEEILLTYHVESPRRHLVEAWSFTMCCKDECHTASHGLAYLDWPNIPEWSHSDQACIICRQGFALCGLNAVITRESRSTIEGFFWKFVCCKIKEDSKEIDPDEDEDDQCEDTTEHNDVDVETGGEPKEKLK